jgi:hypothetical protein
MVNLIGEQAMFRFFIRDMLWLMVAVAIGAGWWSDRIKWRERQATLERSHAELVDIKQTMGGDERATEFFKRLRSYKPPSSRPSVVSFPTSPDPNRSQLGKRLPPGQLEAEPGVYFLGPERAPRFRR